MDYDLLAQFDHPGVDPIAQQQAAQLLSQPPVYPQYAPSPQTQATYSQQNYSQQAYSDPVAASNNQSAQQAWEAARAQQMAGYNAAPSLYEDSEYNAPRLPTAQRDVSAVMPHSAVVYQARQRANRAGLPPELFQLGQDYLDMPGQAAGPFLDSAPDTRPQAYEGGGNVYSQPVTMQQLSQGYNSYVPIHENLHVFEEYLTPEEKSNLAFLMANYPPPSGIPTQHHPPTTEGVATGLTAYIDNWLGPWETPGMTGQRPPTPPVAIMDFIRRMAPIVQERQRSGYIPNGLR